MEAMRRCSDPLPPCCCFTQAPCSGRWRSPSVASSSPRGALAAALGFVVATLLFAADLTMRQDTGHRLFPLAAPTGGTFLILSWLLLVVTAAWPQRL